MTTNMRATKVRTLVISGALLAALLAVGLVWQLWPRAAGPGAGGPLAITGVAGTVRVVTAHIHSPKQVNHAHFAVSGAISDLVKPMLADDAAVAAGEDVSIPSVVTIKSDKPDGTYAGNIELRDGSKNISSVPVTITVQKASANTIPGELVDPTDDRVVTPADGTPMVKDELLVGLNGNMIDADKYIKGVAAQNGAVFIGALPESHTYQLRFPGISADDLAKKRKDLTWVIGVSFTAYNSRADAETTPNDDAYFATDNKSDKPWDDQSNNIRTWGQRYIGLPKAWDRTTGSTGVRIGVIDSGLDMQHPDLKKNVLPNAGDSGSFMKHVISFLKSPHGTYIAGTICAEGNNGIGIAGVMWRCGLAYYDDGAAWISSVQNAMHRAAKESMRVVNMSIGWGGDAKYCNGQALPENLRTRIKDANADLRQEIEWAKQNKRDVLWVFSAGNSCRDAAETAPAALALDYPENTIAVAAIAPPKDAQPGDAAHVIGASNYGDAVSVAAPGGSIYTTNRKEPDDPPTNEYYYKYVSGTSLAAPFVTGLAGLELSAHPTFTSKQVKECILDGATQGGQSVFEHEFKVVNAPAMLDCTPTPDPDSRDGSSQPCVFSFAVRPMTCKSTNPTVTVRFTNVAGSQGCNFESHLSWDADNKSESPQVDKISGLGVDQWKELGTHTFKEPGEHLIGHTVIPLSSGPCTILPSLYTFTLLPNR